MCMLDDLREEDQGGKHNIYISVTYNESNASQSADDESGYNQCGQGMEIVKLCDSELCKHLNKSQGFRGKTSNKDLGQA
jgi:hypothetical protein